MHHESNAISAHTEFTLPCGIVPWEYREAFGAVNLRRKFAMFNSFKQH